MKNNSHHFKEIWYRSLTKTVTYRILILILDFSVVYLLTKRIDVALGFMAASNIYTTIGYYIHERVWDHIKWGKDRNSKKFSY
jgi:uncharacterized membrane protein